MEPSGHKVFSNNFAFNYVVFNSLDPGRGPLRVCVTRLRAPGCGWGAVVVSAAAVLLLAALGLTLALILQREFCTDTHPFNLQRNLSLM